SSTWVEDCPLRIHRVGETENRMWGVPTLTAPKWGETRRRNERSEDQPGNVRRQEAEPGSEAHRSDHPDQAPPGVRYSVHEGRFDAPSAPPARGPRGDALEERGVVKDGNHAGRVREGPNSHASHAGQEPATAGGCPRRCG